MHKISNLLMGLVLTAMPIGVVYSQDQTDLEQTLDIYVLDTEGGESVLYIAPTGEAMLFDTGGGDEAANERDYKRILSLVYHGATTASARAVRKISGNS